MRSREYLERLLGRIPTAAEMAWLDRLAEKWHVSPPEAHFMWMNENQVKRKAA